MVRLFGGAKPSKIQRQDFITNKYGDEDKWKKTRKSRLELDNYKCIKCGSTERLEVDHIVPISKGGKRYALSNLRTLCHSCHKNRHAYSHRYVQNNGLNRRFR